MADEAEGRVTLQYLVADLDTAAKGRGKLLEGWRYQAHEAMLDGPVSRRVAIVDIDPDTGQVLKGAKFLAPKPGNKLGSYQIRNDKDIHARDFQQVSLFGAVMKTIDMFEETDVLGRALIWAFDGEQLLVVPRAGRWANAFYHRDSRSLQFFFFEAESGKKATTVYTCLSPDIVAHETTHAILDGIAPDLYDAVSPQSLALHEAMADLSAVLFALRTRALRLEVLRLSKGDLSKAGAFNEIAREFGTALAGESRPLRDLFSDASFGSWGSRPASDDPHDMSLVLSGALYRLLVADHEKTRNKLVDAMSPPPADRGAALFSASGKALAEAGEKFKRMTFRALDYLPPGEISFADYGRAFIAADIASNPAASWERGFIKEEFQRRGIVTSASELDPPPLSFALPKDLDLDLLVRSDWAAYQFAEAHRTELEIPPQVAFEVRPRLDVTKTTYRADGKAVTRQCIFKVSWREAQIVQLTGGFADELSVSYGTTLVIDWASVSTLALLSTSPRHSSQQATSTRVNNQMRAEYLERCITAGLLQIGGAEAQVQDRTLRVRGLGQLLHMTEH